MQILTLFLIGATFGTLFDGFHTHSGTTGYFYPSILKAAWYVPIIFGVAAVCIGLSHVQSDKVLHRKSPSLAWISIVLGIALLGAGFALSGFLPWSNFNKTFLLMGLYWIAWILWDQTWQGILCALLTGIIGPAVEHLLIFHFHVHFFSKPDLFGVPYWLAPLYMIASVAVGNLGRKLYSR